jgi:ribosomal peptide maturation radical SAM protein 1
MSGSTRSGQRKLVLVCPPFQAPNLSSLSIAQLATCLRARGVEVQERYPHFELAKILGTAEYTRLGAGHTYAGELLFAEGLHGTPSDPTHLRALEEIGDSVRRAQIRRDFLDSCLPSLVEEESTVIGLTTSFHQLIPALFLAFQVKQRAPTRTIVLGGAACQGTLGKPLLAAYPWVDFVVSGPGEIPLFELVQGNTALSRAIEAPDVGDLDAMPIPDYAAFLQAAERFDPKLQVSLTFETSRGCWWGQKVHCKFCGVNGTQLSYRAKTPERALREIRVLWERHHRSLTATDTIMPREYLDRIVPRLAEFDDGPNIFWELKSHIEQADVAALGRARIHAQPGLESLSTHLLRLLGKGGSTIQSLAFLKWCWERNVGIVWNQLYAIPGETHEDYANQCALMRQIPHFPPPNGPNPIRLARFSPYAQQHARFGWTNLRARSEFRALHPHVDEDTLTNLAPFFDADGGPAYGAYLEEFTAGVRSWKERHLRGDGLFLTPHEGLVRNEAGKAYRFDAHPKLAAVLDLTHDLASVEQVRSQARCNDSLLVQMEQMGLVYREGDQILNLAVRTNLRETRAGYPGTQARDN